MRKNFEFHFSQAFLTLQEKRNAKEQILNALTYWDGACYDDINKEYHGEIRINGKTYAFQLEAELRETTEDDVEMWFGKYIDVKRVN